MKAWLLRRLKRLVEKFCDCTLGRIPDTTEVDF